MKRKTTNKIKRFRGFLGILGILLTIHGAVFTLGCKIIAGYIKPFLESYNATSITPRVYVSWGVVVLGVLYLVSKVLYRIYLKSLTSTSEIDYFEKIDFGKYNEDTILRAVDGMLNTEKVAPFFVHAAPKCEEVETIKLRLRENGFAMVSGRPGDGKSMAAYHAAHNFQNKNRYRVYALRTERLENKTWIEIRDELQLELDKLKGRKKLIIVDDTHKLTIIKEDLIKFLQQEAKERHDKYIIIETELYEKKQDKTQSDEYIPDEYIRINFQEFFESLLKNFYQSQDPILQEALKGHIWGLKDAVNRVKQGKILDVWWFAFYASQGWKRLAQKLGDLLSGEDGDVKLLVLFLISAYMILTGEAELHRRDVRNNITALESEPEFLWLKDKNKTYYEIITWLQNQRLINIYDKSKNDKDYITPLHYKHAIAIVKVSLDREHLANNLVDSVKVFLKDEYQKCLHLGIFHGAIGRHAVRFDRENKDWLINFVNNPLPGWLKCYAPLLKGIKGATRDIYDEIIRNLNIPKIAEKASSAESKQLHRLAYFLGAMGIRRNELIRELDLAQLARTFSSTEIGRFHQLPRLLHAIGNRRNELIKELNLAQLAEKADSAKVEQFDQLVHLLHAVRGRRDELIKELNKPEIWAQLGTKANEAKIEQLGGIANLIRALGNNRSKLIEKMNLKLLAKTCNDTGVEVKQFKSLAQLLRELEECRSELIKELNFKKLADASNAAEINQFDQIAELLHELGRSKIKLSKLLDHNTLVQKADQAGPYDILGLTKLISALEEEDRNKYIREVDWSLIVCLKCSIYLSLLGSLGVSLENLRKQNEISPNRANVEKVTQHLRSHVNKIKEELRNVRPMFYSGVARFLLVCNQFDPALAKQIANETTDKFVETFKIGPPKYQGAGRLINAFYAIDPNLSASFVRDNRVKGKIEQSINEDKDDWSKEVEGLKHLIEAFYRSDPELWKKMVYKWITVDLSSLDLDSIYDKVDEEKKGVMPDNTA